MTFISKTVIASEVSLYISDVTGKKIALLMNNEALNRGIHLISFDGKNLPLGVYYYSMQVGEELITKKMILVE